ncbi:CaiB/BaiF CoA transferase family protein [Hydrogenophaga sp. BPS33]|uniref:CaiB/BaiF CoA transferase family protein n=1 Tax=Hydrogenophaga sp. BPS33 TaxID=2651974 RepID=UPI00131FA0B4|nr:CoA transferase [Hydrogenophaga sp. BPS33]QHE88133.1 CoA transferase [Hydrogenophaga sp. BPS33]
MTSPHAAAGVLRGLRVVDFSTMIAGPYCTRWLSDLGAEVIKVEPPEGDHMRHRPPLRDGHSAFFGHLNAGKRCISLDLKQPAGLGLARSLAASADVVVEAFRPGVMQRLGLGAQALREQRPALIYCSISGFGQDTDWSARPAYAPVVHAASGFDMALGKGPNGEPISASMPMADMLTAMFAAMSIQTALLQRQRTGRGTVIDVNLMDSVLNVMPYEFQSAQQAQQQPRPVYRPMRASDGWVLVTPINHRNFLNLCDAVGQPQWREDPLLATDADRFQNWDTFMDRIEDWTRHRSAVECERTFAAQGVPCARYRDLREVIQDPQFQQRDSFASVQDPAGSFLTTRLPFALDGVRPGTGAHAAPFGADTQAVLRDELRLTAEQIDALVRQGAAFRLATPHP